MKKHFMILGLALGLALTANKAYAYSSPTGADPKNGNGNLGQEVETKEIVKSATAGSSEALVAGLVVAYDTTAADGYTVTRAVTNSVVGQGLLACVTTDSVATADTNYHRCITKGFVKVRYDGSSRAIVAGRQACVNASGVVVGCNYNGGATQEGNLATVNTGIVPLQSKTDSGTELPALINLQ